MLNSNKREDSIVYSKGEETRKRLPTKYDRQHMASSAVIQLSLKHTYTQTHTHTLTQQITREANIN